VQTGTPQTVLSASGRAGRAQTIGMPASAPPDSTDEESARSRSGSAVAETLQADSTERRGRRTCGLGPAAWGVRRMLRPRTAPSSGSPTSGDGARRPKSPWADASPPDGQPSDDPPSDRSPGSGGGGADRPRGSDGRHAAGGRRTVLARQPGDPRRRRRPPTQEAVAGRLGPRTGGPRMEA
jgi:hypothetical protein